MKTTIVTLLILLTVAAPASAKLGRTVLVGGDPERRAIYQAMIDTGRAPQAATVVRLVETGCQNKADGPPCVDISNGRTWRLYLQPEWAAIENTANRYTELTVLHEIGHVYDFAHPQDRHRTRFLKALGYEGWLDPLNETWEKFAMAYAYCSAGMTWAQYRRELPADGAFASKLSTPEGGFWAYGYDVGKRDYNNGCRAVMRGRR